MGKFIKNKLVFAIILGGITALLLSVLCFYKTFGVFQLKFADNFYHTRPASDEIVVVKVDEKSLSKDAGLGSFENWNRGIYAKILNNIKKHEPAVVALDFFFRKSGNTVEEQDADNELKEALALTKNAVIMFPGYLEKEEFVQSGLTAKQDLPLELFRNLPNVKVTIAKALKDPDGIIRRIFPGILNESNNTFYENFSFSVAKSFLENGTADIPLDDGQMIINYATSPEKPEESYKTISASDVYFENYGDVNPEDLFKDKIVLIGPTAFNFRDEQLTPMSAKVNMSGIFIHANAIQTILEQKFLRNMNTAEKAGLIVLLTFLSTFVFMYTRVRWSALYLFAVPTAYTLMAPFAFDQGLILDLAHPYLVLTATFISVYVYRYVTEFKQKMELKDSFAKYLNPAMVDKIMAHPEQLKLGGEKREVTVLFTDIAHSTTISEKLTPESLVALLNEYLEAMSEVIMANGGTVDKFEGDAIMAFFGAPVEQADHAALACKTALQMRQKLSQLLLKWQTDPPLPGGEPKPQIDFRCGLSSGEVIVGNVGSLHKFNYTVMGDIVNLGSRLEGANKKYETHTMVSEKTAHAVMDRFEMRVIDTIRVMGKKEPSKVYELIAEKGQLPAAVTGLLTMYGEGIDLYYQRKFAEALAKFQKILETYPDDGPSKLYRQRCEVLRDFPPKPEWDGVYEMGSK